MRYFNNELGLHLTINDLLAGKLINAGYKHYPMEYGGVLLGRYSDDSTCCYVEETILPRTYQSSTNSFERGNEGLFEDLTQLSTTRPDLMYVGEWHTHPGGAPLPSKTDRNAMSQIANHSEVKIIAPILIIIGYISNRTSWGAYVHYNNTLYGYVRTDNQS